MLLVAAVPCVKVLNCWGARHDALRQCSLHRSAAQASPGALISPPLGTAAAWGSSQLQHTVNGMHLDWIRFTSKGEGIIDSITNQFMRQVTSSHHINIRYHTLPLCGMVSYHI
jgi:hypothetical protein